MCVHGGGNGGVYVSGGGVGCWPNTHTHTRPYTSPPETERPTFNHQTHCYIKPLLPHKPACCLLLGNKPPSPIIESRWATAVPGSAQMGQWGQKKRDKLEKQGKHPPIKHVCGIVQICAQHNVHNEVCESGRTEWGKRREEDDLWSFCQKTFFLQNETAAVWIYRLTAQSLQNLPEVFICAGDLVTGGKCTHSCFYKYKLVTDW